MSNLTRGGGGEEWSPASSARTSPTSRYPSFARLRPFLGDPSRSRNQEQEDQKNGAVGMPLEFPFKMV